MSSSKFRGVDRVRSMRLSEIASILAGVGLITCLPASLALAFSPPVVVGLAQGGQDGAAGEADAPAKPKVMMPSARLKVPAAGVARFEAAAVDLVTARAEDAINTEKAIRVGLSADVRIDPQTQGTWLASPDGGLIWIVEVRSANAQALRVHLAGLKLPTGAEAFVTSSSDPTQVFGPYRDQGPYSTGEVWAPLTIGDTARIEVHFPITVGVGPGKPTPIVIDSVQHIYRDPLTVAVPRTDREGSCYRDPTCFPAWSNTAAAVGRMLYVSGGSFVCTGQLVNNLISDLSPQFYTANHCISTNAAANSLQVLWYFQTSSCNGAVPSISNVPTSTGATLIDNQSNSDTTLLMIDGTIPRNLFWVGWDVNDAAVGTPVTGIHHPDGAWKRISFGTKANGPNCFGSFPAWIQSQWDTTIRSVTEGGSSGSGLYRNDNQRLIGVLSCGPSSCGAANASLNDTYGRFGQAFANSGIIQNRQSTGAPGDAFGANQSCATAAALGIGFTGGLVVKINQDDWFSYSIAPGQRLDCSVGFTHANGDIDTTLSLGCGGTQVDSSTGTSDSESLSYQNLTQATVTVQQRIYLFNDTYNLFRNISAPAPANDNCAAAITASSGANTFNNWNATTDGPAEPLCNAASDTQINRDVWFRFTPAITGAVLSDTCATDFDTKLAIYRRACPSSGGTIIGCNDDAGGILCATNSVSSRLRAWLVAGQTYYFRLGGYTSGGITRQGSGLLNIGLPCRADFNADGVVSVQDIFDFLGAWFSGSLQADVNGSATVTVQDIFDFLSAWFSGC